MKKVTRGFVGVFAGLFLGVGLLLQSVIQYVSSADTTAKTATSVLTEPVIKDFISTKIVDRVRQESPDAGQQLVFTFARQRLLQTVAQKLEEPIAAEMVEKVVRAVYRVYVDGEDLVTVDPPDLVDRELLAEIDARLNTNFADLFQTFEIERPRDAQDLGALLNIAQIATWALILIGLLLLAILWRAGRSQQQQQVHLAVPLVIGCTGVFIGAFVIFARIIAPQFSEENGDVVKVLVEYVTAPAFTRAMVCLVVAVVIGGVLIAKRKKQSSLT